MTLFLGVREGCEDVWWNCRVKGNLGHFFGELLEGQGFWRLFWVVLFHFLEDLLMVLFIRFRRRLY